MAVAVSFCPGLVSAQCPAGAIPFPDIKGDQNLSTGIYCLSQDRTGISGNIRVGTEATFIIAQNVVLSGSGNLYVDGNLVLQDHAGIHFSGNIIHGQNAASNSTITIGSSSYISGSGAFIQFNPVKSGDRSQIKMQDGSVLEACGSFSLNADNYPYITYGGTRGGEAYVISRGAASGSSLTKLADDTSTEVIWISSGPASHVSPGGARYCGPNATEATCLKLWPAGLTRSRNCFEAGAIIASQ